MMTNIVYFFVVTMTVVRCSACPEMCICHNISKQSSDNLTFHSDNLCGQPADVTPKQQNTTQCLEVSYLNQTDVRYFFEHLLVQQTDSSCQTRLRLIHSVIPDNITFSNLNSTETIHLTKNNIHDLQEIIFNLPNLEELDLSENLLEKIHNYSFDLLRNLIRLNLSSNIVAEIEPNSFNDLNTLITLDLSKNNLSSLDDSLFLQLSSLQFLNLSHNNLKILTEKTFNNLLELQQLDVSFNKLTLISSAIHLPNLTLLKLNGNNNLGISEEPYSFFLTGHLQAIDASDIGLKQIPASLTLTVRLLQLKGNRITTLQRGDFDSYPLLQNLDLSSNNLTVIEYDALGRLNYLSILQLNNNSLQEFPKSLPENLKTLNFEGNRVQKLTGKDFEGLHSLETLLLKGNNISIISADVGNKLKSLKTLDVSRNPVVTLETGCFRNTKSLKNLQLSQIQINESKNVEMRSLFYLDNIVYLNLSGSPQLALKFLLDATSLNESRELIEVDLRNSNLAYIPHNLLHYLRKLQVLRIDGNKLTCEQLQWLSSWAKQHKLPENGAIIRCLKLPKASGIPLLDYAAGLEYMKTLNKLRAQNEQIRKMLNSNKNKRTQRAKNGNSRVQAISPRKSQPVTQSNFEMSSKSLHNISFVNESYWYVTTSSSLSISGDMDAQKASMKGSPLPFIEPQENYIFQYSIFISVFFISAVCVTILVIFKFSRKRYNANQNQQENELLNPVIELW